MDLTLPMTNNVIYSGRMWSPRVYQFIVTGSSKIKGDNPANLTT